MKIQELRKNLHQILDLTGFPGVSIVLKQIEEAGFEYNKSMLTNLRIDASLTLNSLQPDIFIEKIRNFIDGFGLKTASEIFAQKFISQAPQLPDLCIGRDSMLKDIHQRLSENKQLLLVNGLGGMGKT